MHDLAALRRQCDELRDRGALIALDDAGSGYSGLQQLAALRPQVVKLDRALVSDADTDPVRVALAEMLGEFAGRIDAWLLAEGIETQAELAGVRAARRPPGPGLAARPPGARLRPARAGDRGTGARPGGPRAEDRDRDQPAAARPPARRPTRRCPPSRPSSSSEPHGEPTGLLLHDARTGETYVAPVSLRVHPTTGITDALQRALTRIPAHRFDPVLCTDAHGDVAGLLRVEDLAAARQRRPLTPGPAPATGRSTTTTTRSPP